MWFSLDSSSTWSPSVISAPSSSVINLPTSSGSSSFFSEKNSDFDWESAMKKNVAKPKSIKVPNMPETLTKKSPADEFVQISSNQRWSAQPIGFPQVQNQSFVVEKKSLPAVSIKQMETLPIQNSISQPIENSANSTQKSLIGDDDSTPLSLYKTELCRSFEETGSCRYGLKCQFAHGRAELRPVTRHPKYKTEVCKTFHTIGTCPYGKRCRFIHIEQGINQQQTPTTNSATIQTKPITEFSNVLPQIVSSGWSTSWSEPTPVNVFSPEVVKDLDVNPPESPLIETLPVMKTSNEVNQKRSRLVIFQQICS